MKILFILNAIRDEKTGAAGVLLNLGAALQMKGQEVDYLFRDDFPFFGKDSSLKRAAAFLVFPVLILSLIFLKSLDKKYDIIDISSGDGFLYGIIRNLLKLRNRAKLIMRSHGLEHLYWKNFKEESKLNKEYLAPFQKLFLSLIRMREVEASIRNCDWVICLNPDEEEYIRKISETVRITYIPHGVSNAFFVSPKERRNDLLFVGDWNWRKGRKYLVQIFLSVLEKRPDIRISVLVHRDVEEGVLKSFPEDVVGKVRVLKNLSLEELIKLYASHSIFLFPAIFEGFGCVILEAMAAGMPVVITDDFGWNKIIRNWEDGVLVRKRDVEGFSRAVIKLLEDENLRGEIGAKAAETAKGFDWEDIARKTLSCYSNLIEKYETE